MKRIKCYGRAKSKTVDTSKLRDFFDSDAQTIESLGANPMETETYRRTTRSSLQAAPNVELFDSFMKGDTFMSPPKKTCKKKNPRPLKRISHYLLRNRHVNKSASSSISLFSDPSFSNKSNVKKVKTKFSQCSKPQNSITKGKTVIGRVNDSQSTGSKKRLKNKTRAKRPTRQKRPRKCKKGNRDSNETNVSSTSPNIPRWSSIYEHSLNIEKPLKQKKKSFDDFNNKDDPINLTDSIISSDPSPVPVSSKISKSGIVSHNIVSVHKSFVTKQFHSSTPISARHPSPVPVSSKISKSGIVSHNIVSVHKSFVTKQFHSSTPISARHPSPVPVSSKICKRGIVSHNIVSVHKSFVTKQLLSSTPISARHRPQKGSLLRKEKPQAEQCYIETSTPSVLRKKLYKPYIPLFNISRISKVSKRGRQSSNVVFPSKDTSQSPCTSTSYNDSDSLTSEYGSGNKSNPKVVSDMGHNSNDIMSLADLNLSSPPDSELSSSSARYISKSLAYSSKLYKSTSLHQSSRSCEVQPSKEKSALGKLPSKNSFPSENQLSTYNKSMESLENNEECTLTKLLEFCEQDSAVEFEKVFDWSITAIRKIGEGAYGEVFMVTQKKSSSVIKVIPFSEDRNDNSMQNIETIYSEMKVAHCLSELRTDESNQTKNFNKLKSIKIVKGCYPSKMLVAWDSFSAAKTTYNYRPDYFEEHQTFAILELEYGGKDMTAFVMRNAAEAECIFKQIAISLAIAEEAHLFEHRDLHLGNVLVQRNASKKISYILRGKPFSIRNDGLVVSIIDFTLSRVLDAGCVYYNNLADDESLFNQSGDYQYEVYKQTRQCLNNEWQKSTLYTNVLWLSFMCIKMLKYKYSRPTSKKHLESVKSIKKIQAELPDCQSALDVFKNLQIVDYIPMRSQVQTSRLSTTTKYFDRKSFQKSLSVIKV